MEKTYQMPKNDAAMLGSTSLSSFPKIGSAPIPKFDLAERTPNTPDAPSDLDSDTTMVILPDPVGYNMLIALPTMAEKTKGGIIIPIATNISDRAAAVVGMVLAQGPLCYKDPKRFPDGQPWCKVGDMVMFSRYSGMRFKSKDLESGEMVEYRMLSDDQIVGTVPEGAEVGGL
jgi:co-chaperonin GroES (HSP10)